MSGKGGAGARGNTGISGIPAGSRKMVQSLKEIVSCPEPEIYAMLKECNMDPNEAVGRLLAQDPFREVKSKREKKKENKETTDSWSRGASATHRGSRGGAERYGRLISAQFNSNESGVSYGKPAYRKENGSHAYTGSSSSAYSMAGNNSNLQPTLISELPAAENKMPAAGASESQVPSGFQSPWLGAPGQVSMADIVKMGRPQNKASSMPSHHSVNHRHNTAPPAAISNHDLHSSENYAAQMSDFNGDPEVTASQLVHSNDEWPSIEQPAISVPSALEEPKESELYADQSNLPADRLDQHTKSQLDEGQTADDDYSETLNVNHVGSASVSTRNMQEDGTMGSSMIDGNLYGNVGSYQPHIHTYEHEAEDGASSVTANLQQLNLQDDDQEQPPEEDCPSVIIPNHLQVHAQECSHLSFGSFGAGINSGLSGSVPGPYASGPLTSNLEESSEVVDASSSMHSDARNNDYYGDEHLRNADETLMHRAAMSPGSYESPAMPQQEVLKEEIPETAHGNQYAYPPSAPEYSYDNSQQLNAAFSDQQGSSQMQNINQFTSVMQAYTNSLPSTLLASTVQPGREPDLPYSPFPVTQSMPTKYGNTASSLTGPSISMPEALRGANISTAQPTQQSLPGQNVATGPALPQHLAVHPYSQPTLPLGPFANMIGYPFLPQSYTYMPSAFQQIFAGNNTYHQSLAAVLPQYKNSVSVSSLPQSAAIASAYGFGSSTSVPAAGNFPLNPPTAPSGSTIGYDDALSSQYKDASHLISLQQSDNSGMWVHGPGSRTMSGVPGSTYYSFQGQNQQPAGFRQGQQLSQHFSTLGYPNYYHSQTLEHQQQNSRDAAALGGSQAQPSKQTQQLWQNGY